MQKLSDDISVRLLGVNREERIVIGRDRIVYDESDLPGLYVSGELHFKIADLVMFLQEQLALGKTDIQIQRFSGLRVSEELVLDKDEFNTYLERRQWELCMAAELEGKENEFAKIAAQTSDDRLFVEFSMGLLKNNGK